MSRGAAAHPGHAAPAERDRPGVELGNLLATLPLIAWACLAAAVMAAIGISCNIDQLRLDYGDPDDAMRMVQMRDFLSRGNWFDTTVPRVGGPDGMLSHWSRFIDLPLAILVTVFGLVMPAASAEFTLRLVWPFLLLVPLLYVVARSVESVAGRTAALIVLLLLMASPSALIQFTAGRIDHHNLQNFGSVAAVLLLWAGGGIPRAGRWAGVLAGLAIAIGYEALPLVLVTTLAVSIWGLLDRGKAVDARDYVLTLAVTAALAFIATTAPSRWMQVHCDALSLDLVLLLGCGALGVSLALGRWQAWSTPGRWAIVLAGGLAGAILFTVSEPQCLAGPLSQVPAGLKDVWLIHVAEAQGWFWFLEKSAPGAHSIVALLVLAMAAQVVLWHRERQPAQVFYLLMLVATIPMALWQIKYMPYASILAMPPIAIVISRLRATSSISAPSMQFAALMVANQWCLIIAAAVLMPLLTGQTGNIEASKSDVSLPCYRHDTITELASLPAGLMFAPIDLGSHLLVDTPHSVLAAPYHRIGPAILDTHAILSARTPGEAEHGLARIGAHYVLSCAGLTRLVTSIADHPDTFYARLRRNEALPFLEPVKLSPGSPFKVWRVKPRAS